MSTKAAPASKGAARRRRQKQNALDKCPGYEPNPAFQYLERCKHCGFAKGEHKVIKSSGEGVLYSYLDGEEVKKPDGKTAAEAPLFSFLDVQARTQAGKPKPSSQPGVSTFVPKDAAPGVVSFPRRHVEDEAGLERGLDHGTESAHVDVDEDDHELSADKTRHVGPSPDVGPDDVDHDTSDDEEEEAVHEAEPETESLVESLAARASQAFEASATLRSMSGLFARILPHAEDEKDAAAEKDAEEDASENESGDDDEFDDAVVPEAAVSSALAPPRRGVLSFRSQGSHPVTRPRGKLSITSQTSKDVGSHVSGAKRVSRFFSQSFRGRHRHDSRRLKSLAEASLDVTSARDAHLQQIQRLLKVTTVGAKRARAKFRIYEEPSKETLDLYRSEGGEVVWRKNMDIGWSKLHVAAWNRDDKRVAREARAAGDEIDAPSGNTGDTALSLAVKRGSQACIFALLEAGAAVDQPDRYGFAPLHYAVRNNDHAVTEMLTSAKANLNATSDELAVSVLHMACRYADTDLVHELLDRKLDVNARDARGWPPLFYAVMRPGRSDLVELLIKSKADVRAVSDEGLTALHCATLSDDPEHVTALVERGVRMDSADKGGLTAMHYCARYDAGASLRRLLEYGARLKPRSDSPFTPYEIALHYEHAAVVETMESWRDFVRPDTILDSPEIERETHLGVHMHLDEELDLAELSVLEDIFFYSNGGSGAGGGGGANGGDCCSIS